MRLKESDLYHLEVGLRPNRGFHLASEWYFGWVPTAYQYGWHHAPHLNSTWVAGIATGKTTGVAASYLLDCLTIPYFRALNTSVTAKQAELPFEMVMTWLEANKKLEPFIKDISLRPYPSIDFMNASVYDFRTAGQGARFIRGSEYDRINYDECGLDDDGEAVKVLRGRLRGTRPNGTKRMARMDATTSPTDAPWLYERWQRGIPEAEIFSPDYYSLRVATWDNPHLTKKQVDLMKQEYTDEMVDVELGGKFPDYGMAYFPKSHLVACTDRAYNDLCYIALNPESGPPEKGWDYEEHPRHGIVKFEAPWDPAGHYVMMGDPGTGDPPGRNAACVVVLEVSRSPHRVVYFDWIFGRGSYTPFLLSFRYALEKYGPALRGFDATGTQKMMDEIYFEQHGIDVDAINFATDKHGMLNSLHTAVTNHNIIWPNIRGLRSQMSHYHPDKDKKLAQDIVMTLAGCAFLARHTQHAEPKKKGSNPPPRNRKQRTTQKRKARA